MAKNQTERLMSLKNLESKIRFPVFNSKLFILLVLAFCFKLPGIDAVLASDELAMVSLWGQMPYEKIFQNYQYPNNHIFLTLILSFLLKSFGLYEWLLRTPTLICGVLSVYLGFRAGKAIDPLVGWITAIFLILSEWHIFFSTNARGYLVIMLLAQFCFVKIGTQLKENQIKYEFHPLDAVIGFIGWLLVWTVGSWTLPTFIFFELSLVVFLSGVIILKRWVTKTSITVFLIPFLSLLVGLAAFYFQYYVWISPEMLESATANAAQSSLNLFFDDVMAQWLAPFDSMKFIFLYFAFAGGWILWKGCPLKLFLILSILMGPILAGIFGFKLSLLPGMPHARTYFYLQPFYILLVAVGVWGIGRFFLKSLENKLGETSIRKITAITSGMVALIFLFMATQNTYQEIYLKRMKREPLKRVSNFVQSLNSNDLFIVPDDLHVEFYLYGAGEMRRRVENILRVGEIDKIYILEYNKKENSTFIKSKDRKLVKMAGYPGLVGNAENKLPELPQLALKEIDRFGPFGIHQIKPEWLKKRETWSGSLETVGVIGEKFFQWDDFPHGKSGQNRIKFVDTFLVAVKKKQLNYPDSLMLNLMNISGGDMDFSAAVIEGQMMDKKIKYNPAWRINGWTLDHPYGTRIFNRAWNPAISLSFGASTISVLDVHFFKKRRAGAIKNFLSYEISMPDSILNLRVNKT